MQKILFFITQDLYAKHYLTFDSFRDIEKKYDCSYIASEDVKVFEEKIKKKKNFLGFIKKSLLKREYSRILSDALLLSNKHKSSSFPLRVLMRFNLNFKNVMRRPLWKIPFRFFIRLFNAFKILSIRIPIALIVKNKFLLKKINEYVHTNQNLGNVIQNLKPDLVIIPSSGHDLYFFQSIVECRKQGIKTFAIIDNWDNLSTKSVMPEHPNFVGVWGEQTKKHAIEIQNFKVEQCKVVGSARYQEYFDLRNKDLKSHFNFDYILFLGTSWKWNEEEAIKTLDTFISESSILNKNYKIVYRPHPFRQGKTNEIKLKNIIYDPEILKILQNKSHQFVDLNYYPSLIKNAKFIMGGPQTMMIEAAIFNKYYLALTYDDKINYTNMRKVYNAYHHFRGTEKINTIHYCDDLKKLGQKIIEMIYLKSLDIKKVDIQRQHILFNDSSRYDQKISKIVDEILQTKH